MACFVFCLIRVPFYSSRYSLINLYSLRVFKLTLAEAVEKTLT